jgi:hypothetical protein
MTPDRTQTDGTRIPLRLLLVEDSAPLVQRISELVNALATSMPSFSTCSCRPAAASVC